MASLRSYGPCKLNHVFVQILTCLSLAPSWLQTTIIFVICGSWSGDFRYYFSLFVSYLFPSKPPELPEVFAVIFSPDWLLRTSLIYLPRLLPLSPFSSNCSHQTQWILWQLPALFLPSAWHLSYSPSYTAAAMSGFLIFGIILSLLALCFRVYGRRWCQMICALIWFSTEVSKKSISSSRY